MSGDELLTLFKTVNIDTGNVSPRVIKAWFDTDCEHLLKWMCSTITEECYLSVQEEAEFSQLDSVLTEEQLDKKVKEIEEEYPDIFDTKQNLLSIKFGKDMIEVLEEQIKDCDHEIHVNQQLSQSLSAEHEQVSAEEIEAQLEMEAAQDYCMELSQELDQINKQTYEQIQKYSVYLQNYEFAEFPMFVNNVDIAELEEKFTDTVDHLNLATKVENDAIEMSFVKNLTESLSEMESRIFLSKIRVVDLQMEIEGLNSALNFFENYDFTIPFSCINQDALLSSIEVNRDQQTLMFKTIQETVLKLTENYVNQPKMRCLKSELNFVESKLDVLNKVTNTLKRILLHFITMLCLYVQEKIDVDGSHKFFRNINRYIKDDVEDSKSRKEAMMECISDYEKFSSAPIEKKLKLLDNVSTVLSKKDASLMEIVNATCTLRDNVEKLKKRNVITVLNDKIFFGRLLKNIQVLQDFLTLAPVYQVVIIPLPLKLLLFKVDQNIIDQSYSVKSLIEAAKKPKELFSKNKWLSHQNQLWICFMTDGAKMLSFVEQFKNKNK